MGKTTPLRQSSGLADPFIVSGEKAEDLLAEDVADDACGLCEIEKESHGVKGSVNFAGKRR